MSHEGVPEDGSDDDSLGALLERKRDGVAVLVSGAVPATVHRAMSARLFGSPSLDRRRVIGLTAPGDGSVKERLPPGASTTPDRLRTVVGDGWTRSAGADVTAGETVVGPDITSNVPGVGDLPPDGVILLDDPSLSTFGERLAREMTALNRVVDGFDSGQLRVCLDSIDHLIHDYEDDAVLRFCHLLADQVRRHDGMLHVHTTHRWDDLDVPEIRDVTEVVVRLRLADGRPEFRPYLDGEALGSWGPIPTVPE